VKCGRSGTSVELRGTRMSLRLQRHLPGFSELKMSTTSCETPHLESLPLPWVMERIILITIMLRCKNGRIEACRELLLSRKLAGHRVSSVSYHTEFGSARRSDAS